MDDYTDSEEELLLALDQLAQTVEVMGAVIQRLKEQVQRQALARRQNEQRAVGVIPLH